MPSPEQSFGKRVETRAEMYEAKTKEIFRKMWERTKRAIEFLKGAPFLVAALAVEGGIEAANRGKEAVRESVDAIRTGADKAMEFGRNKKEQAANFLRSVVETARTKVRDARDGLVNRVNEARRRVRERIEQRRKERIRREMEEIMERIRALDEERKRLVSHLRSLDRMLHPQV